MGSESSKEGSNSSANNSKNTVSLSEINFKFKWNQTYPSITVANIYILNYCKQSLQPGVDKRFLIPIPIQSLEKSTPIPIS